MKERPKLWITVRCVYPDCEGMYRVRNSSKDIAIFTSNLELSVCPHCMRLRGFISRNMKLRVCKICCFLHFDRDMDGAICNQCRSDRIISHRNEKKQKDTLKPHGTRRKTERRIVEDRNERPADIIGVQKEAVHKDSRSAGHDARKSETAVSHTVQRAPSRAFGDVRPTLRRLGRPATVESKKLSWEEFERRQRDKP